MHTWALAGGWLSWHGSPQERNHPASAPSLKPGCGPGRWPIRCLVWPVASPSRGHGICSLQPQQEGSPRKGNQTQCLFPVAVGDVLPPHFLFTSIHEQHYQLPPSLLFCLVSVPFGGSVLLPLLSAAFSAAHHASLLVGGQ